MNNSLHSSDFYLWFGRAQKHKVVQSAWKWTLAVLEGTGMVSDVSDSDCRCYTSLAVDFRWFAYVYLALDLRPSEVVTGTVHYKTSSCTVRCRCTSSIQYFRHRTSEVSIGANAYHTRRPKVVLYCLVCMRIYLLNSRDTEMGVKLRRMHQPGCFYIVTEEACFTCKTHYTANIQLELKRLLRNLIE